MRYMTILALASFALVTGCVVTAMAQDDLPKPEPAFKGTIGETYKGSKADFPKPLQAPTGAPNVLIVLLDDVGFGHDGTFGGAVATPTLDRLAKDGLRYNQFHTSGFLEHTDVEVGRLLAAIKKSGELDDTLIFYIVGDNGASGEGGLEGTVNEIASLNGIQLGLAGLEAKFDDIGGPDTEPHVPSAWAANTPFQWTKQVASHFGGPRNGMVIHWPKGIAAKGELRSQFHHINHSKNERK